MLNNKLILFIYVFNCKTSNFRLISISWEVVIIAYFGNNMNARKNKFKYFAM